MFSFAARPRPTSRTTTTTRTASRTAPTTALTSRPARDGAGRSSVTRSFDSAGDLWAAVAEDLEARLSA